MSEKEKRKVLEVPKSYRLYEDQVATSERLQKKAKKMGLPDNKNTIIRYALDVGFEKYERKLDSITTKPQLKKWGED